jgi:hypothetical protein
VGTNHGWPTRNTVLNFCLAVLESSITVPSLRLEDHIRELCALAIAANTTDFAGVLAELRSALHQHSEQLRKLARQQLVLAKGMAQTPNDGERVMPVNGDQQQRIMELVAEIGAEDEQVRFAALVHELNDLLEGKPQAPVQPPPEAMHARRRQLNSLR